MSLLPVGPVTRWRLTRARDRVCGEEHVEGAVTTVGHRHRDGDRACVANAASHRGRGGLRTERPLESVGRADDDAVRSRNREVEPPCAASGPMVRNHRRRRSECSDDQPGPDCGTRRALHRGVDRRAAGPEDGTFRPRPVSLAGGGGHRRRPSPARLRHVHPCAQPERQRPVGAAPAGAGGGARQRAWMGWKPDRACGAQRSGRLTFRAAALVPGGSLHRSCTRRCTLAACRRSDGAAGAGALDRASSTTVTSNSRSSCVLCCLPSPARFASRTWSPASHSARPSWRARLRDSA